MLLSLELEHRPASDLGYLLHKNPAHTHDVTLSFGKARIFYPILEQDRCRATMLLDIDPLALVKRLRTKEGVPLLPYVNDRPYVASSFLATAISKCFGTAMSGRSKERQELADRPLSFRVEICPLACRGGERVLRELLEPLGYDVETTRIPLDPEFPSWGDSSYHDVRLSARIRLAELLRHLYVLIPVLDHNKHYWVGADELDKLIAKGEGWLEDHPHKEQIVGRYFVRARWLTREALELLSEDEDPDPDRSLVEHAREEEALEERISLDEQRRREVIAVLEREGVTTVADLGCGEGKLLRALLRKKRFVRILGLDVSIRALEAAAQRLGLETMPERKRKRLELVQGSLVYRDRRLEDFDAVCVVEVIEHLEPGRLDALEAILFDELKPGVLVITTPNRDYNRVWELPPEKLRHGDHRFEWTRAEFEDWAARQAARGGHELRISGIGPLHDEHGCPTQMAVFSRSED